MNQGVFPAFLPQSDWVAPRLADLPSWADADRVCVDIETCDPQLDDMGPGFRRGDAFIVGVVFAIEDGPAHYLPMRHQGGGNLDPEHALAYLRDQAAVFRGELVGAQLSYDLDGLEHEGVRFKPSWFRDPLVLEPLLDGLEFKYDLDSVLKRRGMPGKDEALMREAATWLGLSGKNKNAVKKNLWKLHAKYVGPYAQRDGRGPLQLLRVQEQEMADRGMQQVWNLESRVLPICHKMRKHGQRVDLDRVDLIATWALAQERAAMAEFSRLVGGIFTEADTMRGEALGPAIERATGTTLPRTPSTRKISVTTDILKELDHPVTKALRRARELNKIRTTFCEQVRTHAVRDSNGDWRVHCTFNQTRLSRGEGEGGGDQKGARTYRFSSTDFNKQNQPNRSPIKVETANGVITLGTWWRTVFLPDRGLKWYSADYSQQEPRIECSFAVKMGLAGAREWADRWRANPRMSVHKMMAEIAQVDIKVAKELRLALGYGMGGAKTCHKYLKLPTKWVECTWGPRKGEMIEVAGDEGQAFIDKFNQAAPYIKLLSKAAQRRGLERGYIVGLGGHQFKVLPGEERLFGNGLIQVSAAGQTKMATVALDEMGIAVQDQIHDELNWSHDDDAVCKEAKRAMENVVELEVPSFVALEKGDNWGELSEVA